MNEDIKAVVTVLLALTGVALVALLVSKQANTSGVLSGIGSSFSGALGCALSPITGGGCGKTGGVESISSSISFPGMSGQ